MEAKRWQMIWHWNQSRAFVHYAQVVGAAQQLSHIRTPKAMGMKAKDSARIENYSIVPPPHDAPLMKIVLISDNFIEKWRGIKGMPSMYKLDKAKRDRTLNRTYIPLSALISHPGQNIITSLLMIMIKTRSSFLKGIVRHESWHKTSMN